MKKKIFSLLIVTLLMLGIFTVSAFAMSESAEVYGELVEEGYDYLENGDRMSVLEETFGEAYEPLIGVTIASSVCLLLSFPVLVVMIVFIVLNVKASKKLKQYKSVVNSGVPFAPIGGAPTGIFSGISENAPTVQENTQQGGQNNENV